MCLSTTQWKQIPLAIETYNRTFFPNMSQHETKVSELHVLFGTFMQIHQSRKRTNIFITSLMVLTAVSGRFDVLFLLISAA